MNVIGGTRRKGLLWKIALLGIALTISGCASSSEPDQARERALSGSSNEVVIGVVWPFEQQNDQFHEGLQLALEQINQEGILGGKKIKLMEMDDEASTTKGMAIAQQFADNPAVSAVIGHRGSSVTVPASRIYAHAGIVLLTPASTSPKLTDVNSSYIFRNIPNDNQLGQALAMYAGGTKHRNIAIYYTDDEYGRGLANAFEDQASQSGLRVVDRLSGYKDTADILRIVDKWKTLDSDLIMVAARASEGISFVKAIRAAGMDIPVIGGDALDSAEFAKAGEAVEGTIVASVYYELGPSELNQSFRQQYIDKYGKEPGKWAAQAYDSLKLLADGIEKAGSRSPKAISAALSELKGWEGVTGQHSFDAHGDVQGMSIVMKKLEAGTFKRLDEVLLPNPL
ncbi:ABC transporter substrate-binding protein [Paenibacillus sp. BIHB 4019]|uniref:ABC transporter substrate-binding protein n=1 Tax=Paenibacillus sp. BIHB 4019 TaxID=1870819 RepID=UPI00155955E3|nr:ABC transporter substrate-binding protein [Paenibacillus sp. BIHB 4019]